jgi:hypothetical protein
MFQTLQHKWWRTFLVLLVIGIGTITTFAAHHRLTTKAASNTGFKMTMGADVYTLTVQAPPTYDSSTNTVHLGTMSVSDNGIDQGTFGGDLSWITDGGTLGGRSIQNETATTSLTGTGSFSTLAPQLSGTASTNFSGPPLSNDPLYNSLIQSGAATVTSEIRDELGDVEAQLTCPENPRNPRRDCGAFSSTQGGVASLGPSDGERAKAMTSGINHVQAGFGHIQTAVDLLSQTAHANAGSSIASLPTHTGGGPRLATQPHVAPFVVALALALIGIVIAESGAALVYYCGVKDHVAKDGSKKGCLGLPKTFWVVLGSLTILAGAAMSAGFATAAIASILNAAAEVGIGMELTAISETFVAMTDTSVPLETILEESLEEGLAATVAPI